MNTSVIYSELIGVFTELLDFRVHRGRKIGSLNINRNAD